MIVSSETVDSMISECSSKVATAEIVPAFYGAVGANANFYVTYVPFVEPAELNRIVRRL